MVTISNQLTGSSQKRRQPIKASLVVAAILTLLLFLIFEQLKNALQIDIQVQMLKRANNLKDAALVNVRGSYVTDGATGINEKDQPIEDDVEYYYKEETDDVEAEEETDDVEDEYGCKYYHASAGVLPIYNQTTWNLIRKTYLDVVGEEKYNQNIKVGMSEKNGFAVPTHVGYSDGKGRGIFVDAPVKKGELVWKEIQTADFDNSSTFKTFLSLLPKSLVCDVREWAYVADVYIGTDGKRYFPETNDKTKVTYKWRIDIEEGSIINNEAESPNIGCDLEAAKAVKGGCRVASWALRDLKVGEEILMDYGDFVVQGTVPE